MLQQTQVATVIPYFQRFIGRFPTIASLGQASQDEVLLHWAGLGYYSRARNIHKAAINIIEEFQGRFPEQYDDVLALPGIGPSTAGAILAQALGQRHPILDGNVKRVLARFQAIEGWPASSATEKQLWLWAEEYTPEHCVADYTQAIMDLGATVCTRASAKCDLCPIVADCKAYALNLVAELPHRKPKKVLPIRKKRFLIIRNKKGAYLREKRPQTGIWAGLWSLPELSMDDEVEALVERHWQLKVKGHNDLAVFRHTFSHFHLDITPCEVNVDTAPKHVADNVSYQWQKDVSLLALAAPVSLILNKGK